MQNYISEDALKQHCEALIKRYNKRSDQAQLNENLPDMYLYAGCANALADLIEMIPELIDGCTSEKKK